MKAKILLLSICLLAAAGLILGKASTTPFTATETPAAMISPGTITNPGGHTHVRDRIMVFQWAASDPRVSGPIRVTVNANYHKDDDTGPTWGSFTAAIGQGTWEGVWHGQFRNMGPGEYDATGVGGGDYAGLHFKAHCVYTGKTNQYGVPVGDCTGRILETR